MRPSVCNIHGTESSSVGVSLRKATVAPAKQSHTTRRKIDTTLTIKGISESRSLFHGLLNVTKGNVTLTHEREGYHTIDAATNKRLSYEKLKKIETFSVDTTAIWFSAKENQLGAGIFTEETEALHAIEHAAMNALTIISMSSLNDVRGLIQTAKADADQNSVFLYETHPGGSGISDLGYSSAEILLQMALNIMLGCKCINGCPLCVQTYRCEFQNAPDSKRARHLLKRIIDKSAPERAPSRSIRRNAHKPTTLPEPARALQTALDVV